MADDRERGTGRTTRQMQEAPQAAWFVSPTTAAISYCRHLADKIGRTDLKIVGPTDVQGDKMRGLEAVVIYDHAYWEHRAACRPVRQPMIGALGRLTYRE